MHNNTPSLLVNNKTRAKRVENDSRIPLNTGDSSFITTRKRIRKSTFVPTTNSLSASENSLVLNTPLPNCDINSSQVNMHELFSPAQATQICRFALNQTEINTNSLSGCNATNSDNILTKRNWIDSFAESNSLLESENNSMNNSNLNKLTRSEISGRRFDRINVNESSSFESFFKTTRKRNSIMIQTGNGSNINENKNSKKHCIGSKDLRHSTLKADKCTLGNQSTLKILNSTTKRPKRKATCTNYVEPNLKIKMRRNRTKLK